MKLEGPGAGGGGFFDEGVGRAFVAVPVVVEEASGRDEDEDEDEEAIDATLNAREVSSYRDEGSGDASVSQLYLVPGGGRSRGGRGKGNGGGSTKERTVLTDSRLAFHYYLVALLLKTLYVLLSDDLLPLPLLLLLPHRRSRWRGVLLALFLPPSLQS